MKLFTTPSSPEPHPHQNPLANGGVKYRGLSLEQNTVTMRMIVHSGDLKDLVLRALS